MFYPCSKHPAAGVASDLLPIQGTPCRGPSPIRSSSSFQVHDPKDFISSTSKIYNSCFPFFVPHGDLSSSLVLCSAGSGLDVYTRNLSYYSIRYTLLSLPYTFYFCPILNIWLLAHSSFDSTTYLGTYFTALFVTGWATSTAGFHLGLPKPDEEHPLKRPFESTCDHH